MDVQSTSRATIERLRAILGGKCYVESRKTATGRTVFRWTAYGPTARDLLTSLAAYLVEKKGQAALAVAYFRYPPHSAMRKSIEARVSKLKRTS